MKTSVKIYSVVLVAATLLLPAHRLYPQESSGEIFEKGLFAEEVSGDLSEAISLYQQVLEENTTSRQLAAQAMLHLGICYEKQGSDQARKVYRDVMN